MVRLLEGLDDVPGLAFHDGDLSVEHSFFEVQVHSEDAAKGVSCLGPPGSGGQEGEEVVAGALGEGLADEGDGQEEPAEGVRSPLYFVRRISSRMWLDSLHQDASTAMTRSCLLPQA